MKIIKSDYFKKNVIKFKDDWNDIVDNHIDSDGYSPFNKIIKYNHINPKY